MHLFTLLSTSTQRNPTNVPFPAKLWLTIVQRTERVLHSHLAREVHGLMIKEGLTYQGQTARNALLTWAEKYNLAQTVHDGNHVSTVHLSFTDSSSS